MDAVDLIENLQRSGIDLRVLEGDGLRVAPASRLTPAQRESLRLNKAALVAAMKAEEPSTAQPEEMAGGPLCRAVQQLPETARELLDCLLWLQLETGALSARALATASGWPLGLVFSALDQLMKVDAVWRSGADYRVAPPLLREL